MNEELFTNRNMDDVLEKLNEYESKLDTYDYLQQTLKTKNVLSDRKYQTKFKGYYRVRRGQDWCEFFFSILEKEKANKEFLFLDVLQDMWRKTKRFEASFSSKLIATINPENPVWDANVLRHLKLSTDYAKIMGIKCEEERIAKTASLYRKIQTDTKEALQCNGFGKWEQCFNMEFPQFEDFTKIKKLDLFFWQLRESK